jgi:hypothetical protein
MTSLPAIRQIRMIYRLTWVRVRDIRDLLRLAAKSGSIPAASSNSKPSNRHALV